MKQALSRRNRLRIPLDKHFIGQAFHRAGVAEDEGVIASRTLYPKYFNPVYKFQNHNYDITNCVSDTSDGNRSLSWVSFNTVFSLNDTIFYHMMFHLWLFYEALMQQRAYDRLIGLSENSGKMYETVTNPGIGANPKNRTCQNLRTNSTSRHGGGKTYGRRGMASAIEFFERVKIMT
jgi:hypothetical protein